VLPSGGADQAREGSFGRKLGKAAGGSALKGGNPKGASGKLRANPPWAARDSCRGQSLEVGVRRTGSLVYQREIASS
jgi:hypothetical protein